MLPAAGRRIPSELLDRREAILARDSAQGHRLDADGARHRVRGRSDRAPPGGSHPVHVLLARGGALGRPRFRDHRGEEPRIGGVMGNLDVYEALARQLRADSIRCSTIAGSGHPTSSLSAADLMPVLLAGHLRYDWAEPRTPANDHLIFSKGHASPLNYALFRAAGAITDQELMTFRKLGSRLEGHPTPVVPWVDVATGSLGQGLPIAVGIALAGKRVLGAPDHVWTLTGDSELAEGSIWEGLDHAGHERLAYVTAVFDVNRLGQRGPTELERNLDADAARVRAFGCEPIVIDGHDLAAIDAAFGRGGQAGRPAVVVGGTGGGGRGGARVACGALLVSFVVFCWTEWM